MNQVFVDIVLEERPTESAVWGVSKWGSKWFKDGNLYEPIKAALDKRKQKENNTQDALIAEAAIKNDFTLVTDDNPLRKETSKLGAECMSWEELTRFCRR